MKERRNAYNELVAKVYRMITSELHTFLTLTLYDSERSASAVSEPIPPRDTPLQPHASIKYLSPQLF
jgi:hypothetical protein